MKKFLLYSLFAAAAFTMASCDEDFNEGVAEPQSWEQEELVTLPGFSLAATSAVDLAAAEGDSVTVFSMAASGLPEGTAIDNIELTLTAAAEAATKAAANVTIDADTNGKVAVADLQAAVEELFGKRPVERTMSAAVKANWLRDGQATEITCAAFEIKATPEAPQISKEYFLIGDFSKWDVACTDLKFNHSGKDVYEDSEFTIVVPVEDGTYWFAFTDSITINSGDWANVFGCVEGNGLNGEEGKVARRSELSDDGSLTVTVDGDATYLKITLNMMEYTYKIEKLNFAEFIYEIGNNTNWGDAYALHGPNYDGIYHGAMYLKSGFKFRSNAGDWNGDGNWGWDADSTEGKLINDGGSSDIKLDEDGFYKITVDLTKMEYTLAKFEKLGIIGDGQAGGWDKDTELTYDATELCWKATGVELTGGKSIKFRTVGDWNTVNIGGGSLDKLVFNSNDNIPVAESGTFTVKLFLETSGQPYATLTKE